MKLETKKFGAMLALRGYEFYSGVPCSFLSDLINYAINDASFIMSANEGDAVASCAGAFLAGKKAIVLMQNSGLSNAMSPLTSLNYCFKIPVLGFVSLRGEPGLSDEPQHELMGTITEKMLETAGVRWEYLSESYEYAEKQLDSAERIMSEGIPFFFIVKKGIFEKVELNAKEKAVRNRERKIIRYNYCDEMLPSRMEILTKISELDDKETLVFATTGKTGRELYEINDSCRNFYMVGSMGCVSSLALGTALNKREKKVIAVDGDGALLMRMGNMPTIGCYGSENLLHILLDNRMHDSTGGQCTVSYNMDWAGIANACGYSRSVQLGSVADFVDELNLWRSSPKNMFIHVRTNGVTKGNLGRPKIKPYEAMERFKESM